MPLDESQVNLQVSSFFQGLQDAGNGPVSVPQACDA